MTALNRDDLTPDELEKAEQRAAHMDAANTRLTKIAPYFDLAAMSWLTPVLRMVYGDTWANQRKELARTMFIPLIAVIAFLVLWQIAYSTMVTVEVKENFWSDELMAMVDRQEITTHAIPGPVETGKRWYELLFGTKWGGYGELTGDDLARAQSINAQPSANYWSAIRLSIIEVFIGFLLGALIAIPLGIFAGLSKLTQAAVSPFIQIFRPVSPVAWLLVVQLFTIYFIGGNGLLGLSASAVQVILVVALCSLWPTLINTALGVRSIDQDLINVSDVLRLSVWKRIVKVVLPSAIPVIFAALRVGLGVGWMVLIAAEALAQSSGLGLFMWDLYQNGDQNSMVSVMVTVFTIGVIGFFLDRLMVLLQATVAADGKVQA